MSAANGYFQMGVWLPLENWNFAKKEVSTFTLSANITAGTDIITINETDFSKYGGIQDKVVIGASSNTSSAYTGKQETRKVSAVSGTSVTLDSVLSYSYNSGDTVTLVGSYRPAGWIEYDSTQETEFLGMDPATSLWAGGVRGRQSGGALFRFYKTLAGIKHHIDLNDIYYAQYRATMLINGYVNTVGNAGSVIVCQLGNLGAGRDMFSLSSTSGSGRLLGDLFNRVEAMAARPQDFLAEITDSSWAYVNVRVYDTGDTADYYAHLGAVIFEHALGVTKEKTGLRTPLTTGMTLDVWDSSNFSAADEVWLFSDKNKAAERLTISSIPDSNTIVLTSAPTNTYLVNAPVFAINGGYYEFTEYPMMGSLSYQLTDPKQIVLGSGTRRLLGNYDELERTKKGTFSCYFQDVPEDMYLRLLDLKAWQDRGNLLTFHPFVAEYPQVMVGKMFLSGIKKGPSWHTGKTSFNFSFREMV